MSPEINAWISPAVLFLAPPVLVWALRLTLGASLERYLHWTSTSLDDHLVQAFRPFALPAAWLLGCWLALHRVLLDEALRSVLMQAVLVAAVMMVSLVMGDLLVEVLEKEGEKRGLKIGSQSLTKAFIRLSAVILGGLLVLANLGISITPLLTALGVGSLAVALALQDTLANLFAGIHIMLAGHIKVDDYLRLDTGQEGYVTDIGWRSTRIRELPGNIILVPNQHLAKAIITNYNWPTKDLAVLVNLGVAYGSDLTEVERVTIEVATEVLGEVEGGVGDFVPFIRYNVFGDSAIQFTVILRAKQFSDRYLLTHEFIKRLHHRFGAEGIEIPFPQRVITTRAEGGGR